MKITRFALLAAGLLATAGAQAAGDPAAGQTRFESCLGCHGVESYNNVYPTYRVPKIAGQHAMYIDSSLKAYRDGSRTHSTMNAQAGSLTDAEIADIAAYLESLR